MAFFSDEALMTSCTRSGTGNVNQTPGWVVLLSEEASSSGVRARAVRCDRGPTSPAPLHTPTFALLRKGSAGLPKVTCLYITHPPSGGTTKSGRLRRLFHLHVGVRGVIAVMPSRA